MPIAAAATALALASPLAGDAAAGEAAQTSKTARVEIVSFAFKPASLTIAKGSRVTFANTSTVSHTATRNKGFDTGVVKPGKSVSIRFKQKGTFAYHCTIHPSMRGKVVVD